MRFRIEKSKKSSALVGVEHWWPAVILGGAVAAGMNTLYPRDLVTARPHPQLPLPCRCRSMLLLGFEAIGEDSDAVVSRGW